MLRSLVAAVQFLCVLRAVTSLEIDTSDGGYTNLIVSIDERVHRDESIIKNIKALFRSSSQFLHQATSGRVYFKHVVIAIPLSWSPWRKVGSVSSKSFGKSDVRVVDSSGTHVDHPFTKHVKQCGQRGEFIQLPRTFLAELNTSTTAKYRNPAYVFVHEWAHYRYGVFDEYGSQDDDDYPLTYCHKNKVKLNSCSEGIHFTAKTETGQKCKIKKNCQFPKDCLIEFFQPKEATIESSIMFMPYQSNIKYFCDNIKKNRTHNSFAPNKQNRFCNGMPAWEVIKHNDDFRKLPRPNMTKSVEPVFEEIRRDRDVKPVVVLVLDVSGSMFMYHRLDFLKEAAARYIQDIPEDSVYLAIVAFETTARLLCCPRHVNRTTRHGFIEAVWKLTYLDGTCIGCGLDLALAVVSNNSRGAVFILITDGEHNGGLSTASVKPKLIAAKVKVTTVALGSSADSQLEELALDTGGKAYVFEELEGRTIPNILAALVDATTAELDDRVSIKRKEGIFSFPMDVNFLVDDTVGIDTTVHISHLDREKSRVIAWLSDPDGYSCDSCCVDRTWLSETITIPGTAKAGNWTLHMKNPGSRHVDLYVEVKSRARNQDAVPVELACEVSAPVVHVPDLVIYAHLKSGDEVILDADVFAEVLGPNPQLLPNTPLHDDGHYPDIVANDGTYSGYFTAYTGPGMYTVIARAVNHNQAISATPLPGYSAVPVATVLQVNDQTGNQSSPEYSIDDFDLLESSNESLSLQGLSTAKKLEAFERAAVKRSFEVATYIYERDIPPMSIRDLRVTDLRSMSDGTLQVKLAWTWPGAHLTSGKASSVEIRISKDYEELVSMFEEQTPITDDDVVDGSLIPLPSGTKHVVNISLPDIFSTPRGDGGFNYSAVLAVRVGNSDGLKSNVSNVVSVHHVPPSRKPNPGGVIEDDVDWIWMWVVIGLVVAGVLTAILVVVITKMKLHKRDIYPVFLRKRQTCQDPV